MVRLARGAARGHRGKPGRGRGGLPPPLMARNNVMPPPIPPPRMLPPRMRPLPPPGMRSPPFAPPIPPPLPPPHVAPHMRPPPPRLPPVPPIPPLRRNLPFHPRPPVPMFPPHGPIHRMHPPIPPPLMRGRGRLLRGMELRHSTMKMRKLGVVPFKPRRGKKNKPAGKAAEDDFFCTTCDRGFKTEEQLDLHCSEHIVCGIDGCNFTAHSKIVSKHVVFLHESGLYNKVTCKDDPEDIARWIAERKRNYPTQKNIDEKKAEIEELEQRGERLHVDKRRFANKTGGYNHNNPGKCNKNELQNKSKAPKVGNSSGKRIRQRFNKLADLDIETGQEYTWMGTLPHFPGTDLFPEEDVNEVLVTNENGFSDEEWESNTDSVVKVVNNISDTNNRPVASVLSALSAAYDSDAVSSEEEAGHAHGNQDSGNEKDFLSLPVEKLINRHDENNSVKDDSSKTDCLKIKPAELETAVDDNCSDSGPDEAAIIRKEIPLPSETANIKNISSDVERDKGVVKENEKRNRKRKRTHKKSDSGQSNEKRQLQSQPRNFVPRRRLSLLQKLLEPEIRHERNVILQCIRYIVENNFFGIGQ